MKALDLENTPSYLWGNNCKAWTFSESESLTIKLEKMPPGTSEELHFHAHSNQFFYILTGSAILTVTGNRIQVKARQGITIEPGFAHKIANETTSELEFLLISNPSTKNDRINLG